MTTQPSTLNTPRGFTSLPWIEIGILLLAAAFRLILLDAKPPHFDEGVNGWFADQMAATGLFRYDPTNYHGPLHFYAVFLSQTLFGRNLWALRIPAIISSLLAVWAVLRYREFFGPAAARIAALAMAVSPAYVFYGRYSIHESWMVFFQITLLWGVLGLWQNGGRRFLNATILGMTGMILTKETYVIHAVSLALTALTLWAWQFVFPSRPAQSLARQVWTRRDAAGALAAALIAIIFFYSGNFLDFSILRGLYETFAAWFYTGVEAAGHEKTAYNLLGSDYLNFYWIALMTRFEAPALLGLVLCIRYVFPSDARLRYIAIYGGGILLAFSLIPYKTPWCIISILWPFYLILGAALSEGAKALSRLWQTRLARVPDRTGWVLGAVVTAMLSVSAGQSIWLNFYHATDETVPYVYVQTFPEIATFTQPLLDAARRDPSRYHVRGQVIMDSYYPLPWMLGDFTRIGYYKKLDPPPAYDGDFVVCEKSMAEEVEKSLSGAYYRRPFRLRDSQEECVVYFREEPFREWFNHAPPDFSKVPQP